MKNTIWENLQNETSGIELDQVPAISQKRLLTFVNHFIITTVSFLNDFAETCESKLISCDHKIRKAEAELSIIEAKLNSIPGLEDITEDSVTLNEPTQPVPEVEKSVPTPAAPEIVSPPPVPNTEEMPELPTPETGSEPPPPVRNPELERFYKMLQFGVPLAGVKQKMAQEGFDPDLIDS